MKNALTILLFLTLASLSNAQTGSTDSLEKEEPVFELFMAQDAPKFIGGDAAMAKFIRDNLVMPDTFVETRVLVEFVVESDSSVSQVQISKRLAGSIPPEQAQACIDVVQMSSGKWIPAHQRNKPVRCRLTLPISFR